MGMGVVSDKEFDAELSFVKKDKVPSDTELTDRGIIVDVTRGRGVGNTNTPDTLRKVIGETAVTDGREEAIKLAANFGISPSSVSAYTAGATSTSSYSDRPNLNIVNQAKERISKRARIKLMDALKYITDDKLQDAKVKELAGVARDMSAIVKNMESDDSTNKNNESKGPTFVFYSPQFKKEEHFDVVQSKD